MANRPATRINSKIATLKGTKNLRALEHYNLLLELYGLLGKLGLGRDSLQFLSDKAMSAAKMRENSESGAEFAESLFDSLTVAGNALYMWSRDKRFLSEDAKPKLLSLHGKSGSVEQLVRLCDKSVDSKRVASDMVDVEMVRKVRGGYLPRKYGSPLAPTHPLCKIHFLRSLRSLIWSIENNMFAGDHERLIERKALVQHLPVRELPAFRDLTRQQGASLISTMNDWLESRCQNSSSTSVRGPTSEAGVHFFSFIRKRPKVQPQKSVSRRTGRRGTS